MKKERFAPPREGQTDPTLALPIFSLRISQRMRGGKIPLSPLDAMSETEE
jgi:hypothetical protein